MLHFKFQSKLIGLLLFAIFSTFVFTSNVFAQEGKLVEAIDIQGNRRLADKELLRHIKTRLGERFDGKQVQDDLQSLLKLGLFNTSQTRVITEAGMRGGVLVIFEVMELPLIVELNFDGLRYAAKEELLAELREQKAEIEANSPYQPERLRKARNIITEYLVKKRGFVNAKVDVTTEDILATTLKVAFVIDEMPNDDEEDCCEK